MLRSSPEAVKCDLRSVVLSFPSNIKKYDVEGTSVSSIPRASALRCQCLLEMSPARVVHGRVGAVLNMSRTVPEFLSRFAAFPQLQGAAVQHGSYKCVGQSLRC